MIEEGSTEVTADPPEGTDSAPPQEPDFLERRSAPYRALMVAARSVSITLMVSLFVVVLLQVVTRYVFNTPLAWTEEIARFLLVWSTFVAAGYVAARRQHITVDLLTSKLSRRWAIAVDTLALAIVMVASVLMAVASWHALDGAARLRAPASGLPISVIYLAGLIGFGLIAFHNALNIYVNVRHPDEMWASMDNDSSLEVQK